MTAPQWLVEVLEDHRLRINIGSPVACSCGWEDGFTVDVSAAHREHVAQVIAAALVERLDLAGMGILLAVKSALGIGGD